MTHTQFCLGPKCIGPKMSRSAPGGLGEGELASNSSQSWQLCCEGQLEQLCNTRVDCAKERWRNKYGKKEEEKKRERQREKQKKTRRDAKNSLAKSTIAKTRALVTPSLLKGPGDWLVLQRSLPLQFGWGGRSFGSCKSPCPKLRNHKPRIHKHQEPLIQAIPREAFQTRVASAKDATRLTQKQATLPSVLLPLCKTSKAHRSPCAACVRTVPGLGVLSLGLQGVALQRRNPI